MKYLAFDTGDDYLVFYRESPWVPWDRMLAVTDTDIHAGCAGRPFWHASTMAHIGKQIPLAALPERLQAKIYKRAGQ